MQFVDYGSFLAKEKKNKAMYEYSKPLFKLAFLAFFAFSLGSFLAMGASYAESSIHINAWFGDYDKKSSLRYFTKQLYAIEEQDLLEHSVYFGDSFNDQVLFSYIPLSIGMHSVEDSRDGFEFLPKYITDGYGGIGFAEACRFIADINPSEETN